VSPWENLARVAELVLERAAVGWILGSTTRFGILIPLDDFEYQQR
jgi:hypothetical protein